MKMVKILYSSIILPTNTHHTSVCVCLCLHVDMQMCVSDAGLGSWGKVNCVIS